MMPEKKDKRWVKHVMETSFTLTLPEGLFTRSAKEIAQGLKEAAEQAETSGTKFQSAMSMLNFYINRAGKNLREIDRARLERAKVELRKLFGKEKK